VKATPWWKTCYAITDGRVLILRARANRLPLGLVKRSTGQPT
jgi:hypothetical protein